MKHISIFLFFLCSLTSYAQTPILEFDGVDDYVGFGTDAAMNARTVEFWFKLNNDVDQSLQNEIFLFGTEITGDNLDEWHITLTRANTVNPPGTLRFAYVVAPGQVSQVYSDSTSWDADRWYHVAVVIDQAQGLMMFVDGVKQNEVEPNFTSALMPNGANVEAGRHLNYNRYFEGAMDDLRTSSQALYLNDFTPPCPDLTVEPSTIGLWNFNEGSGSTTNDASGNNYNGQIFGATWNTADVCRSMNTADKAFTDFNYYPNPSSGLVYFEGINIDTEHITIVVYDAQGKTIIRKKTETNELSIDLSDENPGIYSFQIISKSSSLHSGRIIKE